MTTARGGDAGLRALRAEAERDPSPATLMKLAHALARAGAWDEAAERGTIAAASLDASDLWDALSPPLEAFEVREPRIRKRPQDVRWTPDGRGLIGLAVKGIPSLVEVDLASGDSRVIVAERDDLQLYWDGSSPTPDPRGRFVAFGSGRAYEDYGVDPETFLVVARRDTGQVVARIPGGGCEQVIVTGAGVLGWREPNGVRLFQLRDDGALARPEPIAAMRGKSMRLSNTGELVRARAKGAKGLELADLLGETTRGVVPSARITNSCPIGRRLVSWVVKSPRTRPGVRIPAKTRRVCVHGADGALLFETSEVAGLQIRAPSRSGRLMAYGCADDPDADPDRIVVVDLATGARREFPCRDVIQLLWSPSGRKLIGLPFAPDARSGESCEPFLIEAP